MEEGNTCQECHGPVAERDRLYPWTVPSATNRASLDGTVSALRMLQEFVGRTPVPGVYTFLSESSVPGGPLPTLSAPSPKGER